MKSHRGDSTGQPFEESQFILLEKATNIHAQEKPHKVVLCSSPVAFEGVVVPPRLHGFIFHGSEAGVGW